MKKLAILGSTGYIGRQTLDVVAQYPRHFKAEVLTTNNNVDLLINQAIKFQPRTVIVANDEKYIYTKEALNGHSVEVLSGNESFSQIVAVDYIDTVVGAIVGFSGLNPILNAIKAKKSIALANKETLVVAGELINTLCKKHSVSIIPIDSEHSAIFQCLVGENIKTIEKIILTASGGPFWGKDFKTLKNVTPLEALKHPTWSMGNKITIDSATLMNKGFEVIETKWLFQVIPKQIEVVIHPQSVIHCFVQFKDGSIKAQLSLPDMKLPILYALSYPKRFDSCFKRFSFSDYSVLNFENPSNKNFKCLNLAYKALEKGGNIPCVLNAANEVAVNYFLENKIRFTDIPIIIEKCMEKICFIQNPTYDDYTETHYEAVKMACNIIKLL